MTEIEKDMESLKGRLMELNVALANCSPLKIASPWWLDRLAMCATIRRQIERIEREPGVS